jgi:Zn-dependent protease with chaperone function
MTSYRYPGETVIFWVTFILLLAILIVTAGFSACLIPLFAGIVLLIAYQMNKSAHRSLQLQGTPVTAQKTPVLAALVQDCVNRLQPDPVDVIVVPAQQLNAYTFGLSNPKVVVLFKSLFNVMDDDEIRFILGHELGHVALGHTWLNTLLGGMAGVPTSLGGAVVLTLAFRWWNRACEYSADRAGMLACGNLRKAISALIKLEAGGGRTLEQLERALKAIEKEDDSFLNELSETLYTHPMTIHRIEELERYARTPAYRELQAQINARA